jgi:exodeoxyribonuclease V beta subunit
VTRPFDVNETALVPGTLLLEASAGTGKTWSITSIAVRLILEGAGNVEEILLVTFTRKATDELRQRLRERLHQAERVLRGTFPRDELEKDHFLGEVERRWGGDRKALGRVAAARRDVDLARVRTIHSFCHEVLGEGAFEAGLPLDGPEAAAGDELVETAWLDTLRECVLTRPPLIATALKHHKFTDFSVARVRTALRELGHPWLPVERPFDGVVEETIERVRGLDFTSLARFTDTVPEKGWVKHGREKLLPVAELFRDGFDLGRGDHRRALLALDRDFVQKGLRKKDQSLLSGSQAEALVEELETLLGELRIHLEQALYRRAGQRYEQVKERRALVDHDDVIAQTRARLFASETGDRLARRIGDRFKAALVDEFQDTDGDQWEIFRKIFTPPEGEDPRHVLVLVGDPKQAIYRFRGADIYAYLQARKVANDRATLTRNWRSTPRLVDAVNSIFGSQPAESFALEQIGFAPVEAARPRDPNEGTAMRVVWVETEGRDSKARTERAVLERLAYDIVTRRTEVPVGEGRQLAVLVQEHRQARAVMRALRDVDVDAVLARGGDIHDSEAMRELRVILRALLDPSDLRLQRRARATRTWGTTLSGLGADSTGFEDVELFAVLRRTWIDEGVATMVATLVGGRNTIQRCLGESDGLRLVTDLRHAVELLNRAEAEHGYGPEALLRWAEAEARSQDPQSEERPLRLDRQSDAVQVLTNFTSKGLEFDTVFLPFAWHRREYKAAPPLRVHDADDRAVFDFRPGSPLSNQAVLEEVASDLRMHYVELTRARELCVVYLSPNRTYFPWSASAFLLARAEQAAGADRAAWVRSVRAGIKDTIGEAHDLVADRLATDPSIEFVDGPAPDGPRDPTKVVAGDPPGLLDFPDARRPALIPWRQLSYTALVRSLQDRLGFDPVEMPLTDRADPSDAAVPGRGEGIFGFARGARAGVCLHELLEHSDFTRPVDAEDRSRVQRLLVCHNLDAASEHPGDVDPVRVCLDLVEQVRTERLPFGEVRFDQLGEDARLDEWQFNLPVVDLVPARIGALVREHWGGEEWIARAAERMVRLPEASLQGMLGGFVDLLFTDGERWTVLDWKSNDLGPDTAYYTRDEMRRAMVEHDYVVQLLFYLVAIHRHLRTRIADYDYDRYVAGASYVFLRGLCGDGQHGWCNVAPPRSLIEAVDQLFAGGGR